MIHQTKPGNKEAFEFNHEKLGGSTGYISSGDIFFNFPRKFSEKTLQLFVPNSKRLGGYTQWVHFLKKYTPLDDLMKRYMVSLKKALGRCMFLLGKT